MSEQTPVPSSAPTDAPVDADSFSSSVTPIIDDTPVVAITSAPTEEPSTAPTEAPVAEATAADVQAFLQQAEFSAETQWNPLKEVVSFPSATKTKTHKAVMDAPAVDLTDTEKRREWSAVLADGLDHGPYANNFQSTVSREGSDFRQGIKAEAGVMMGAHATFAPLNKNEELSGDRASLRVMDFLNLGTIFQTPLWHSGFWITFRAPSEAQLLELHRQITADKIEFGRRSYGLAYSNTGSYVTDRLVTFALQQVYQTTVLNPGELKNLISSHDIPAILWGLVNSIYPNGFQYQRACVKNPNDCNHIVKERLNLGKLQWTDSMALTKSQLAHMGRRQNNIMTVDSVKKYQEELLTSQPREIILNEQTEKQLKLVLKVPTVAEYVESGSRWIGDIVNMVTNAMGLGAEDGERNEYIIKQGQASAMRQYTHWVKSFEFDGSRILDTETLEQVFSDLSSDDNIRDEFMTKVMAYINDSAISIIGIPVYECPACGTVQETDKKIGKKTSVIPIDMFQTFFTLLVQKLGRMQVR